MRPELFATTTPPLEDFLLAKRVVPLVLLALFWCWETWRPFFGHREGRWPHALHNLAIALFNTLVLGIIFGSVTVVVAGWTEKNQVGLLNSLGLAESLRFGDAFQSERGLAR